MVKLLSNIYCCYCEYKSMIGVIASGREWMVFVVFETVVELEAMK